MKKKQLAVLSLFGALVLSACGGKTSSSQPASSAPGSSAPGSTSEAPSTPSSEEEIPWAEGLKNYAAVSYQEKEKILGELESYVLDNFLGGIPFADNAANVMYNSRLTIPSDTYVPGYGFGVGEGTINSPMTLEQEPEEKYAWYYHSWQSADPGTINYWDGQDSVTADLHAMVSSSYWSTRFNDDKTGYEWYPQLARGVNRPIPLNLNPETNMATKWRVPVRLDEAVVYDTLSTNPTIAAFKGRQVQLADYLTPFKAMLDNQLFRATDLGSQASGFVGVTEYLTAIQKGETPSWSTVGIQLNEAEGAIEFEFKTPKTAFYAMYNLSSSLFSPIPEEFLTAIGGVSEFGKPNINSILSLGMYTLEEWQIDKQLAFKKNPTYFEADRATHAGYKYTILADNNVAFQEFLAGKLDGASIPSAQLKTYKNDPRTRKTLGDTVWKLQVNATDQARWEELFGEEGSIYPHARDNYWDVKPVMSNYDFLNGLYFALDRVTLADNNGRNPAQAFLSDAYMIDPEAGISFRDSDTGKAVIANRSPETFGYSLGAANMFFNDAMDALVAEGKYVRGTTANPTEIKLSLIYQTVSQVNDEGQIVKNQLETAFNAAVPGFKLVIEPYATANWMDAYYKAMQGDFDLAFGSISGNTLDPISFMDTVTSDNRTGFTLSWGVDTNTPTTEIFYDGLYWSYDALLGAAIGGAVVEKGAAATLFRLQSVTASPADGTGAFTITATGVYYAGDPEKVQVDITFFEIYNDGDTVELEVDDEVVTIVFNPDGTFVVTIEVAGDLGLAESDYLDLTVYFTTTIDGSTSGEQYQYLEFSIPAAE